MLKLWGCILTILAAALLGACAATELEESYQEMQYLHRLMVMLRGEIQYSREVFSHIFLKLSKEAKAPYDAWMRQMCIRLEARRGGSFDTIWKECIRLYLGNSRLPRKELAHLMSLGEVLGEADLKTQVNHLKGYLEQLELSIQETRGEIQNKKKLCRCMGIISGIFIAVLLM